MANKKKPKMEVPEYPKVIETFRNFGDYEMSHMKADAPSCFNGNVQFRKYRITIELIDEPLGLLEERLEKLWCESDNHHHLHPLKNAAASIGYVFTGEHGCDKKPKTR